MRKKEAPIISRYGLDWDDTWTDLDIELECIRRGGQWKEDGVMRGGGLLHHYRHAQRLTWPEDDHHRWAELGLRAIVENDISVFVGCGDSGKTYTISRFVLIDWWSRPDKSLWLVSSTELRGAELRIWGVLKQLFNRARDLWPKLPGRVLESLHCITTDEIDEDQEQGRLLTRGIVFVPCKRGNSYVGMGSLMGIKPQAGGRLGHAGDEVSAMPRVFLDAYSNWYGKEGFKGVMSGNPFDLDDSLCVAAEPVEGWASWKDTEKTQTWRSKFYNAFVIAFDGRDSPNFDPPVTDKTRYPYLIGARKMKAVAKTHGVESWQYRNQCVGKPQPGAAGKRVVTRAMCDQFHVWDNVVWADRPVKIGACDAAYGGIGGDRCVAGYIEFGKDIAGRTIVAGHPPVLVPVSIRKPGIPEDQIATFVKEYMEAVGVSPDNFFFDGRGSMAVSFARIWSPQINAVEFGGRATPRPVSNDQYIWDGDVRTRRLQRCDELYNKFVTELWFSVHYTIISDQMRQLPREVAEELCRREWRYGAGNRIEVETKEEMKERTGESPDLADFLVTALEGARRRGFSIARLPTETDDKDIGGSWRWDLRARAKALNRSFTLTYS